VIKTLKKTEHPNFSDTNYRFSNNMYPTYFSTFSDFLKSSGKGLNFDTFLLVRYYMKSKGRGTPAIFELRLLFVNQGIGDYNPVLIDNVVECHLPEINKFLAARFEHLKNLWSEFL